MITQTASDASNTAAMTQAWRTVRIVQREMETADIVSLTLADPAGTPLPDFTAGAHIDVEIQPGLVRQYSLLALPDDQGVYRIGVLKDPASRGGSVALHALPQGAQVRISAPRNHFALADGAHHTLLFAATSPCTTAPAPPRAPRSSARCARHRMPIGSCCISMMAMRRRNSVWRRC
jgi:vanillate O-demethylase ferredoxin subunit